MTMSQAQVAQVIAGEAHAWCAAHGLSRVRSLYVVLMANAWGESALIPNRVQPGGGGRGLFQCDVHGGLGLVWIRGGGTEAELFDPHINTRLILWEAGNSSSFMKALSTGTVADAVRAFVYYVERPKLKEEDTIKRQGFARTFAGGSINIACRSFG